MTESERSTSELLERERDAWRSVTTPPAGALDRIRADVARRSARSATVRATRIAFGLAVLVGLAALVFYASRQADSGSTPSVPSGAAAAGAPAPASRVAQAPAADRPAMVAAPAVDPRARVSNEVTPPDDAARAVAVQARVDAGLRARAEPRVVPVTSRAPASGENAEAPAPQDDTLGAEFRLLGEARVALRNGDPERAIALGNEHRRRFPAGVLAPERNAIERRARCAIATRAGGVLPAECAP